MNISNETNLRLQPFVMLLVLFGIMMISLFICLEVAKTSLPYLFSVSDADAFTSNVELQIKNPNATLYYQAVVSTVGMFLIPTLFFHLIFNMNLVEGMGLNFLPNWKFWAGAIPLIFISGLFIQALVEINQSIKLPLAYLGLRNGQAQVDRLIDSLFYTQRTSHFILLSVCLALLPAIAEEICFRGTIMNLLAKTNLGWLGAIIVSGFTFSLMHLEFDNFTAIWFMGIILGLIYYYSGSIWLSIAAHFINNMVSVLLKWLYHGGHFNVNPDSIVFPWYYYLFSIGVIYCGILGLKSTRKYENLKGKLKALEAKQAALQEAEADA